MASSRRRGARKGLVLSLTGRAVPSGLLLQVNPEVSAITGYVEDAPVIAKNTLTVSCMVESGAWVVLAGLDDWRHQGERRGIFRSFESTVEGLSNVVVVLRADRVGVLGSARDLEY